MSLRTCGSPAGRAPRPHQLHQQRQETPLRGGRRVHCLGGGGVHRLEDEGVHRLEGARVCQLTGTHIAILNNLKRK